MSWNPCPLFSVFLKHSTTRKFNSQRFAAQPRQVICLLAGLGGQLFFLGKTQTYDTFLKEDAIRIQLLLSFNNMYFLAGVKQQGSSRIHQRPFHSAFSLKSNYFFKRLPCECCMKAKRERQGWYSFFFPFSLPSTESLITFFKHLWLNLVLLKKQW